MMINKNAVIVCARESKRERESERGLSTSGSGTKTQAINSLSFHFDGSVAWWFGFDLVSLSPIVLFSCVVSIYIHFSIDIYQFSINKD